MNYFHTWSLLMSSIIPSLPSFVRNYMLLQVVQVSIQCYLHLTFFFFLIQSKTWILAHSSVQYSVLTAFCLVGFLLCVALGEVGFFFLPGNFYHFHILSVPLAMRCFVPLSSSTKESHLHHLPFLDKHLIIQSQLHTYYRKMSSTVFQRLLLVILKLGMLSVHRPCQMPLCTCNILKKIHKQILAK